MCDLLQHQSAPEVEIETFRDDSFLGVSLPFISVFKRSGGIENRWSTWQISATSKVYWRWGKSYQEALHSVQQTPEAGYQKAKNFGSLQERDKSLAILEEWWFRWVQKVLQLPYLIWKHHVKTAVEFFRYTVDIVRAFTSKLPGNARGRSRSAATSKMGHFVIIVNDWKLTIIKKHSILDIASVLDPPLNARGKWNRNKWNRKVMMIWRYLGRKPELSEPGFPIVGGGGAWGDAPPSYDFFRTFPIKTNLSPSFFLSIRQSTYRASQKGKIHTSFDVSNQFFLNWPFSWGFGNKNFSLNWKEKWNK